MSIRLLLSVAMRLNCIAFFDTRKADLLAELRDKKAIDDDLKGKIVAALNEFKKEFTA